MGGVGHLCTCARAPPSPYLRIRVANCAKIWCVARNPIVTRFTRVGGGVTTFARARPVSLSRKPLSPGIEATPKTDLSLSRSLVHRQTWRLTGVYKISMFAAADIRQTPSTSAWKFGLCFSLFTYHPSESCCCSEGSSGERVVVIPRPASVQWGSVPAVSWRSKLTSCDDIRDSHGHLLRW